MAVCLAGHAMLQGQDLIINEIMSDNTNTLQDSDGDFSDWIELYNRGTEPVQLGQYFLSDSYQDPAKWSFPNLTIQPNSYLVIFASGKDRYTTGEVHTNFRIAAGGETIYLSDANEFVDHMTTSSLDKNDVYERFPDGKSSMLVSKDPTPGKANIAYNQLVFSAEAGFHTKPFYLQVSSLSGDTVCYSLNSSLPRPDTCLFADSLFLGYKDTVANYYSEFVTSPPDVDIGIKGWQSPDNLLDKAHVLRCASYRDGIRTSYVYTRTYFVDKNLQDKYDLPVISLVSEEKNLFDYDSGLYVPGVHFSLDDPLWTGNYYQNGRGWEKPVHIEYFDNTGELGFSQDAGLRIHGGKSRIYAQKSLRLYARKKYGKNHFCYPLLPRRSHTKYDRFLLQTSMGAWNGHTVISDAYANNVVSNLNIEYQDYQPVVVFINGEYWGIHTLRDKIDTRYIAYTHDYNKDSVNMIQGNYKLVQAGTNENYLELAAFIETNDLSIEDNYEYVKTQIDISNFIDYQLAEMYFSNTDWPSNNQKLWQPQRENGRWRWILFDLDAGFGSPDKNMIERSLEWVNDPSWLNEPVSIFLFNNLLNNKDFRTEFLSRYTEVLHSNFSTNVMEKKLNTVKVKYDGEMPRHIQRWHFPASVSEWETDILDNISSYIYDRPCAIETNIRNHFAEDEFGFSCVQLSDISDELILAPNPGDGNFFIYNNGDHDFLGNLTITDLAGTTFYRLDYLFLEVNERKYFNLYDLSNGIYLIRLSNHYKYACKKLLIMK